MKVLATVCLFVLFMNNVQGQTESILIEKHTDTVVVVNKDAVENCAAKFAIDVTVQGFDVTVVETDTVAAKANCICRFDLYAYLTGLPSGTYTVSVYRQYLKKYQYPEDRKVLIGGATFEVTQPQPGAQYSRVFQSPCLGFDAVDPGPAPVAEITVRAFPNPSSREITIQLDLASPQQITLILFDEIGNEVTAPETVECESGTHEIVFPASAFRQSGVYYCAVIRSAGVKFVPFLVVK
jgi:hypothetical protein